MHRLCGTGIASALVGVLTFQCVLREDWETAY